jgi:hypothetical protein
MSFSYTYTPGIINRYKIKTLVYKPSFLESDSTVSFIVTSLSLGYFPGYEYVMSLFTVFFPIG